jgi:hypothetical protein
MPEEEAVRRKLAARSDFDHVPSRRIRVDQVRRLQEGSPSARWRPPGRWCSSSRPRR